MACGSRDKTSVDEVAIDQHLTHEQTIKLSTHVAMGLPTPAETNEAKSNDYLLIKNYFALSYNNSKHIANWVSWNLNPSYLGTNKRNSGFNVDNQLPSGWLRVSDSDYRGYSGIYDRGHMVASADRNKNDAMNDETFLLTNVIPQASYNNQGPWQNLETYIRNYAKQNGEVYIIAGGIGEQERIGRGIVAPTDVFKIAVFLKTGQGASDVATSTRVISVIMPNNNSKINVKDDWKKFRVSVDEIERKTGFDFLSQVPTAIQNVIESRVDTLP